MDELPTTNHNQRSELVGSDWFISIYGASNSRLVFGLNDGIFLFVDPSDDDDL